MKQRLTSYTEPSPSDVATLVVDRRPVRTARPHGLSPKELNRLDGAVRLMQLYCSPRRNIRLWKADLRKGAGRQVSADVWKRITKQQRRRGLLAYSVLVFEPDDAGLHAHIIYVGDAEIEAHLRGSAAFAGMFEVPDAIKLVGDPRGLTLGYFAKTRTPQAGWRRTDLGGRLRGSHKIPGGGDRVRPSRDLERDAIEAEYIEPWQHTYARRSEERKPYRVRALTRRAPKPAGQIPLLDLRPVARLRDFGGGLIPPAVAIEIEFRRKCLGVSQRQLGRMIGRSQGQYANAIRGHDPMSSIAISRLREIFV